MLMDSKCQKFAKKGFVEKLVIKAIFENITL